MTWVVLKLMDRRVTTCIVLPCATEPYAFKCELQGGASDLYAMQPLKQLRNHTPRTLACRQLHFVL